jgi:hypothetical protein
MPVITQCACRQRQKFTAHQPPGAQTRHADGHEVEPHGKDGTDVEEGDNGREEDDKGAPERGSRRSACRFS